MNELLDAFYAFLIAREEEENKPETEAWPDDEDAPVLLEDEIAEILEEHKGEEILVHYNPEGPVRFRYYCYKKDKAIVFKIYDALENHCLVTVNGTNIVDL